MKIVELTSGEETVPPEKYGAVELLVKYWCDGFVDKGHETYLFASGDSLTKAELIPLAETNLRNMDFPAETTIAWREYHKQRNIVQMIKKINELKPDIVHNNMNYRFMVFADLIDSPVVSTMHAIRNKPGEHDALLRQNNAYYISISDNQRNMVPDLNWTQTIYHGVDMDRFEVGTGSRDYFVFLGRTNNEKGLSEICQMIKKTNHKLKIAAKIDGEDREYYETKVKPFVDGEQIEYVGELGHDDKARLLRGAKAMLLWLNWEEPFGLVVPEAYACGTPVIVNKRGSMSEIIDSGKTGFLVDSLDEMQSRLDDIGQISNAECRAYCEQRFSKEVMIDNYLKLFQSIIDSNRPR